MEPAIYRRPQRVFIGLQNLCTLFLHTMKVSRAYDRHQCAIKTNDLQLNCQFYSEKKERLALV